MDKVCHQKKRTSKYLPFKCLSKQDSPKNFVIWQNDISFHFIRALCRRNSNISPINTVIWGLLFVFYFYAHSSFFLLRCRLELSGSFLDLWGAGWIGGVRGGAGRQSGRGRQAGRAGWLAGWHVHWPGPENLKCLGEDSGENVSGLFSIIRITTISRERQGKKSKSSFSLLEQRKVEEEEEEKA